MSVFSFDYKNNHPIYNFYLSIINKHNVITDIAVASCLICKEIYNTIKVMNTDRNYKVLKKNWKPYLDYTQPKKDIQDILNKSRVKFFNVYFNKIKFKTDDLIDMDNKLLQKRAENRLKYLVWTFQELVSFLIYHPEFYEKDEIIQDYKNSIHSDCLYVKNIILKYDLELINQLDYLLICMLKFK